MVNDDASARNGSERDLVLAYAAAPARPGLAALLALDDRLGSIVARAREPMIGQMRLTWWFEALEALDTAPPPAEPLLRSLAAHVLPVGVAGSQLARMIDGWDLLLEPDALDEAALMTFARERGGGLFTAAAAVLGAGHAKVRQLGEGWALADLATRWGRREAAPLAAARPSDALARTWPRALRPLGALALSARADLSGSRAGSPRRVGRLLWHRLTGR